MACCRIVCVSAVWYNRRIIYNLKPTLLIAAAELVVCTEVSICFVIGDNEWSSEKQLFLHCSRH